MIKFLLYLFLFYVLFRLIFGRALGGVVKTKVYHFNTQQHHHHYNQTQQQQPNSNAQPKHTEQKGQIGEYVDYEEIK